MKKYAVYVLISLLSALFAIVLYGKIGNKTTVLKEETQNANFKFASMNGSLPQDAFIQAAKVSTPAVVHINTEIKVKQRRSNQMDPFWQFFGMPFDQGQMPEQMQQGAGSGVIISNDGYIVTNNHVVEGADKITVNLHDNRSFTAKLVGADPTTDLAVIKIDAADLAFLTFANSDEVEIGQWVLAVGNPFNLSSTVTAGIVSAKARNINILREKAGSSAVESFIQTDAAVNPGNSGGALVDLNGNLIGINAAIATPTGSYAGYSFAIPSNLAKKVVKDMIDFGVVQRGFLGVNIREVDDELAKDLKLEKIQGAYVVDVVKGGAAEDAGLKNGDVITKIGDSEIKNTADLTEHVARYRPGETVKVEFIRNGSEQQKNVTLKSKDNTTALVSKADVKTGSIADNLGIEYSELTALQAKKLGVAGGVRIDKIKDGIIKQSTNIEPGFIVFAINNQSVKTKDDFEALIKDNQGGGILLQGKYEDRSGIQYYAFGY
jgi:Do/DeqQ family serine protease